VRRRPHRRLHRQATAETWLKHPPEILVTTPESLYLLLGSAARETLRTVQTVILDEIHALAPTKRGATSRCLSSG
jgi:ATP-dependent Lhr-like helicase